MKALLALFLVLCVSELSIASAYTKKPIAPSVSREKVLLQLVSDCIARHTALSAREEIFAHYINSPHLRGTSEKIAQEVCLATYDNIGRFHSQEAIESAVKKGLLVHVINPQVEWARDFPIERHTLRPWAADFLKDIVTRAHTQGIQLRITSLARTTSYQGKLARKGASPLHCKEASPLCSTHTNGAAIDISTRNLSTSEIAWLTQELLTDMQAHRIIFIREYRGGHFHIFVPKPQ